MNKKKTVIAMSSLVAIAACSAFSLLNINSQNVRATETLYTLEYSPTSRPTPIGQANVVTMNTPNGNPFQMVLGSYSASGDYIVIENTSYCTTGGSGYKYLNIANYHGEDLDSTPFQDLRSFKMVFSCTIDDPDNSPVQSISFGFRFFNTAKSNIGYVSMTSGVTYDLTDSSIFTQGPGLSGDKVSSFQSETKITFKDGATEDSVHHSFSYTVQSLILTYACV